MNGAELLEKIPEDPKDLELYLFITPCKNLEL